MATQDTWLALSTLSLWGESRMWFQMARVPTVFGAMWHLVLGNRKSPFNSSQARVSPLLWSPFFSFYWRIITEFSYSSDHISFQSPNAIAFSSRIHSTSNSNIFLFLHRQSNQDVNSGQHTGHTALRHLCLLDHFSNNLTRLNLENSLPNVYLDGRLVIYRGKVSFLSTLPVRIQGGPALRPQLLSAWHKNDCFQSKGDLVSSLKTDLKKKNLIKLGTYWLDQVSHQELIYFPGTIKSGMRPSMTKDSNVNVLPLS